MPDTGAPWNLPYPASTDRPDLAYDQLYNLANRVDYHSSVWARQWERLRRRPAAKMSYDSTVRYKINTRALSTVQFNNVQLDTAQMTDLQKRADRIYLPYDPRPALYMVGGSVTGFPATAISYPDIQLVTNAQWSLDTTPNPDVPYSYSTRDQNASRTDSPRGETFQVSSIVLAYQNIEGYQTTPGLADIWMQIEINSSSELTVYSADMWAFWLTDIDTIPFS